MPAPSCSDEEFMRLFKSMGATEMSKYLGIGERSVYLRRRSIERSNGTRIDAPTKATDDHPARHHLDIDNGVVLIASDAHYWPSISSLIWGRITACGLRWR